MDIDFFLEQLNIFGLQENIPNISEKNAIFLRNILREKKTKNMLEIGTANGYSTLQFAREIQKNKGCIDTIEFSQIAYEMAQENFETLGMGDTIHQFFGDAREIIPLLEKQYDFIFIDGLKKASLDFFLLAWEKCIFGGCIVIDDVIKFRHKMENLYIFLSQQDISFEVIQIDPDDGIMIIEKK